METVANAIRQMQTLSGQVFLPDTTLIADYCKNYQPETGDLNGWTRIGKGVGILFGFTGFANGNDSDRDNSPILQGEIPDRDLTSVHAMNQQASEEIQEYVSHSRYGYSHDVYCYELFVCSAASHLLPETCLQIKPASNQTRHLAYHQAVIKRI